MIVRHSRRVSASYYLVYFLLLFSLNFCRLFNQIMSGHDNEELIDYEDEQDVITNGAAVSGTNGASAIAGVGEDKEKKNFSGIHSTGFR